jgi:hypothetical protein
MISHGLWERRYGADPEAIGKTIRLDLKTYTIVACWTQEISRQRGTPSLCQPAPTLDDSSLRAAVLVLSRALTLVILALAPKKVNRRNNGRSPWAQAQEA